MPSAEDCKGIEVLLKKVVADATSESDLSQLRRDWFNNVVEAVEKMGQRIETLAIESYKSKEDLIREINSTKEKFRGELRANSSDFKGDLRMLETRFDRLFDDLKQKVAGLSASINVEQLKLDFLNEINKVKNEWVEKFDPIKTSLTTLKAKLAVWGLVWGALGACLFVLIAKYLFGVPI